MVYGFERRATFFSGDVRAVVLAIRNKIKKEDIPIFLISKHPLLDGLSPIEVLWHDGKGRQRVLDLVAGMDDGSFT